MRLELPSMHKRCYQFLDVNTPELILLDVEMPDIDGYEVCQKIKAQPKFQDIPIIFLTVKRESEDIIKGFELGAVDYMTKPFNRKELISRVNTHISLKHSRDELARKNHELEMVLQARKKLEEEKDALTMEILRHQEHLEKMVDERTKDLATANQNVTSLIQSITDGFMVIDEEWRILYISNPHHMPEGFLGREMIGEIIWDVFPKAIDTFWYKELHRSMENRTPAHFETTSAYSNDSWYDITIYPFDDGVCSIVKNITEKRNYENEMKRLSGLDLIGQMAAGISHEIRNPMTTVRGFLQLLNSKEDCNKYNEYFTLMIDELDRANSIITEFLSMGNTKSSDLKEMDLNAIIHDMEPLLHADAFNQNKKLQLETTEIPCLPLNRNEIRQLLLNLYRNGVEAMSEEKTITIKTCMEKNCVVLAVKDEGTGIKPEIMDKLGTPFFTTKDNGTGLGLGVCLAIAARHNAKIDIQTSSEGTTFLVIFNFKDNEKETQERFSFSR